MRKLLIILGGLVLGGFLGWVMDKTTAIGDQLEQAIVAAPATLAALLDEFFQNRTRTKAERLRRLVEGDFYRDAAIVVLYLVLALQVCTRLLGAIVGVAIGLALAVADVVDPDAVAKSVASSSPLLVLLLSCGLTVFFAKYAAHHLRRRAFGWISLGLLINTAIDLGAALGYAAYLEEEVSLLNALFSSIFAFALLVGAAAIGTKWAQHGHDLFVLNRLSRQLSPSDRNDLISLVADLPGVKSARR